MRRDIGPAGADLVEGRSLTYEVNADLADHPPPRDELDLRAL